MRRRRGFLQITGHKTLSAVHAILAFLSGLQITDIILSQLSVPRYWTLFTYL